MSISVSEELIGKKVCYIYRSVASREIKCATHTVTGYMVFKEQGQIRTKIRLNNGEWEYANNLFYPEDEAVARLQFVEKFGK